MNLKTIFSFLFILVIIFSGTESFSQWNNNPAINTSVCIQPYDQQDVHIVTDGKNGAIMTWTDFRNDATQTAGDIFAQRIDKFGYNVWAANGVAACTNAGDQTAPAIAADDSSGAIIAWTDQRNGNRDIYAQKIDSLGNIMWAANGAAVAVKAATQQNVHLISDGAGGAIITWEDSVNGAFDIYAQRLSNTGTAMWTAGGVGVCTIALGQINPKIISDGAGGAVISWQDFRNGNDYNIYAQKINSSGAVQWTSNGVAICTVAGTQSNPKLRGDGSGGAIIVWQDKRFGTNFDVYAQRVNSAGVVQWTANGVVICNAADNQSAIDLTNEGISGAIIAWKDNRSLNNDIYAQYINLSGAVQWTANGVALATGATEQINPNTVGDGIGGAIIVWQDSSAGNWDVKSQRVSSGGAAMWTAGGESIGTATGTQSDPKNVSDGLGGSIYVWNDKRNTTDFDIYAHHLFSSGTPVGIREENMVSSDKIYPNPFSHSATVTWKSDANEKVSVRIMDVLGNVVLVDNHIVENHLRIDRDNMKAGIYFYEIISEGSNIKISNGKFVITE